MFLGRVWRKKRSLSLLAVQTLQKASSMSLWRPPAHNVSGRERNWFEACYRSHGAFCGCGSFILHLTSLAARFNFQAGPPPPGGPRAESPPILRALPAPEPRRHRQTENPGSEPWPGDGGGDGAGSRDGGQRGPSTADAGGDDFDPADLEDLLAAVEEDEQ